ncbi:MAG TPA: tetratricopeptide repeat protein [bacterium]
MQKSIKEDIKFLEGKLEKNPESILFARLADAYLQADRIEDAIELCENGIKKHPFYVTGHYVLAKIYLKKKLFDQAEKELKRVLLFDPKFIAAHRNYGDLMSHIGWNNTCEMSYEEILHIDAFNEQARQRLKELKEHSPAPREPRKEIQPEVEYDMIEENILAGVGNSIEEEEPLLEKIEPEKKHTPPDSRNYYPHESTNDFEDEQTNLDMLEDIFRDDIGSDIIIDEDVAPGIKPKQHQKPDPSFDITEPKFLSTDVTQKAKYEEFETEDFDGLEDDEIFSIIPDEQEQAIQEPEPDAPEPERKFQKKSEPPKPPAPVKKNDPGDSDKRKEKIVTPTLGEIYAAQQQYAKAIGVYEILRKKDPDNELYRQKIEYLQKKLDESLEN